MPAVMPKALKIVKASAGSGKTFSLTRHFIILLFSGEHKYREILAVTFTNKATAEMKRRIMMVLNGLAQGHSDGYLELYRTRLKEAYPRITEEEIRVRATLILRNILHDYGRFSISTIDKFVQKIVRGFTYELGIESGFRLEMNYAKVVRELSHRLHQSLDDKPALLKWIIDYAREQIENNGQWSYEATLIHIAKEIFSEDFREFESALNVDDAGEPFQKSLQLIFSIRKEYEEESSRYFRVAADIFSRYDPDPVFLKGKSKNKLLSLKNDHQEGWLTPLKKYIDAPEKWAVDEPRVAGLYEELNPVLQEMERFDALHREDNALASLLRKNIYYLRLLKEMNALLAAYRSENLLLLISDATYLLSRLSEDQHANPSFIWEKMGNRYRYFLFDEFQDTSRQQWQNFLPLLRNALSEFSGEQVDHLIVGDVKQSIYRWRSGDWRLLLQGAAKDIGSAFVTQETLLENYRSAANIIRFNNVVFDYGPKWLQEVVNAKVEREGGSDFFNEAWKDASYDVIITNAYGESVQGVPPSSWQGGTIDLQKFEVVDNRSRLSQVKAEILEYTAQTLYRWIAEEKRYQPGQIGILVRTKQDALDIIDYLSRDLAQRPQRDAYELVSGDALKIEASDSIQLLINALYLLVTPDGDGSIYKANCVQLYRQLQGKAPTEVPAITADQWLQVGRSHWTDLEELLPAAFCREGFSFADLPVAELIERLIGVFDLDQQQAALPYIFAFRDAVSSFVRQGAQGTREFLLWWEEEKSELSLPSGAGSNVIQVVTIHKSKGLAYDVVMLPFAGWEVGKSRVGDNFWTSMEGTPFHLLNKIPVPFRKELNHTALRFAYWEEYLMRVMDALNELYVALTRARLHLAISIIGHGAREPQSFLVSDIISYALQYYEQAHATPYDFGAELPLKEIGEKATEDPHDWSFAYYPLGGHLKLQLGRTAAQQVKQLDEVSKRRMGALAHEVLSQMQTPSDLSLRLRKMQAQGQINAPEALEIRNMITDVVSDPRLQELLSLPGEHLEEQTILSPDGNNYRPDKVILTARQTIIIDYKFTTEARSEHRQQLNTYKDLLEAMGYRGVRAYLYYGLFKELVEV